MAGLAHLTAVVIIALSALGARYCLLEGQILDWIGKPIERIKNERIRKPLGTCERCMVSTWGLASFAIVTWAPMPWHIPVYLLAAVGLQEMFDR